MNTQAVRTPRLTVVIPVWDGYCGFLPGCVESVLAQDEPVRVLVVDNASRESLPPLPPEVEVARTAHRVTAGGARNAGLRHVETPYVAFVDADDRVLPEGFSFCVRVLEVNPGDIACATSLLAWDPERDLVRPSGRPREHVFQLSRRRLPLALYLLGRSAFFLETGTVLRTSAVRDAGGFGEGDYAEDWQLAAALAFRGPISLHARPGGLYRIHGESLYASADGRRLYASSMRVLRKRIRRDRSVPLLVKLLVLPPLAALHELKACVLAAADLRADARRPHPASDAATPPPPARIQHVNSDADELRVLAGVRTSSSVGVARYCDRLAEALAGLGVDYRLTERPLDGSPPHFHVANSSRRPVVQALGADVFAVTLHDVMPRMRALEPFYRAVVYPKVIGRAAATIVHSSFAADLLRREGGRPRRLEVILHPARRPASLDRDAARADLQLPGDRLIAVLPGVIKSAKLVREAVAAFSAVRDQWLLVLAGPLRDRGAAEEARAAGTIVIEEPDAVRYEQAIVAADVVLCLRSRSVGETNGPLLDALGAGRAVLATAVGSIPEIAGEAARYVEPRAAAVEVGLRFLADPSERQERELLALRRTCLLSWEASAQAHIELFEELGLLRRVQPATGAGPAPALKVAAG